MKLLYCILVLLMSFTANVYANPPLITAETRYENDPTDDNEEELEEDNESLSEIEKAYKEKHHN